MKAHEASNWSNKGTTTNFQFGGAISALEKTIDWSFASAYKGTFGLLSEALDHVLPVEFTVPEELLIKLREGLPADVNSSFQARVIRDEAS